MINSQSQNVINHHRRPDNRFQNPENYLSASCRALNVIYKSSDESKKIRSAPFSSMIIFLRDFDISWPFSMMLVFVFV